LFKVILCYYFLLNNIMSEGVKIQTDEKIDIDKRTKDELESDAFLNQASLDYLINTKQYKIQLTNAINKKINRKDKKFYRRRILSLTKDLLSKEESEIVVSPDIKYAFDNLVKTCIHYFKILDRNDIIQEGYNGFDEEIKEEKILSETEQFLKEENEKLLMRSVKLSNHSLDNFIKIKMTKQPEKLIIPQQKEINLKDPILKNKGVIKKKNIINNYDEDTKKQSKETNEIKKDEK
jgi:hypothetical protein